MQALIIFFRYLLVKLTTCVHYLVYFELSAINILHQTLVNQHTARTLPWNEALEVTNVFMYSFIVSRQRNIRFRLLLGGLLLLGQVLDDLLFLGLETLLPALTGLLCLWTTSFGLVAVRQSIGSVNIPTFPGAEPSTTGLSWHWKFLHWNLRQELLAGLVCLQLVNVLHEDALVLKHVTLGLQVKAVVPGWGDKRGK